MEWLGWAILLLLPSLVYLTAFVFTVPRILHWVCPLWLLLPIPSVLWCRLSPRACSLGYIGILIVLPVSSRLHACPAGREGPATVVEASLWTRRRGRESFTHSLS